MPKFYVLTIDGGGVRGVIPAIWLKHIETICEGYGAHKLFDMIVGTSGGAIVGAYAALGYDLKEAADLYDDHGQTIFPDSAIKYGRLGVYTRIVNQWAKLLQPAYRERDLRIALRRVFGNKRMDDCKTRFMLTSYDTESRAISLLKSFLPEHKDIKIWEASKASSSAPTYFAAHILGKGSSARPLIDGGVFANNPSMLAIAEALESFHPDGTPVLLDDIVLVSLGSGNMRRAITRSQARKWGAAQWVRPLLDIMFDSTSEMNDRCAKAMMFRENYIRLQVPLINVREDLDDASKGNLDMLRATAKGYITHESDRFEDVRIMMAPRVAELKASELAQGNLQGAAGYTVA